MCTSGSGNFCIVHSMKKILVIFLNDSLLLNFNKKFVMLCKWNSVISLEISSHKSMFLQMFTVLLSGKEDILWSLFISLGFRKARGVKLRYSITGVAFTQLCFSASHWFLLGFWLCLKWLFNFSHLSAHSNLYSSTGF